MVLVDVEIEKAVIGPFKLDEFADIPAPTEAAAEFFDLREGGDAVCRTMEKQHRGEFGANLGGGAEGLGALGIGEAPGKWGPGLGIDDGAVEHEGLRAAGDFVHRGHLFFLGHCGEQCEESPAGRTAGGDASRIDLEGTGVLPEPTDKFPGVLDGLNRTGAMFGGNAGFDGHGDGSMIDQMQALRGELRGHGIIPEPALEKDNHRAAGGGWRLRLKNVGKQIALRRLAVDVTGGILEQLAVAGFANYRQSLQNMAHVGGGRGGGQVPRAEKCLLRTPGFCPMVSLVKRYILAVTAMLVTISGAQDNNLRPVVEKTYQVWREAMIRKDSAAWQRTTASHRRMEVRNRIVSEKKPFPGAVFLLPAAPPPLTGLKFLEVRQQGPTAKASYFGKIDFGVGGTPTDNLLVLAFVNEGGRWLYDRADFVNLEALPEVRRELAAGDLKYLNETPEARPSGKVPDCPIQANPAKYIAKVYVFSPGREVKVQINKISRHRFANVKDAEIVTGGAVDGLNEVQYAISKLPGGTGTEALTIRVYLLSEVAGVKPIKAFEYQVQENQAMKSSGTGTFNVDAAMVKRLMGK